MSMGIQDLVEDEYFEIERWWSYEPDPFECVIYWSNGHDLWGAEKIVLGTDPIDLLNDCTNYDMSFFVCEGTRLIGYKECVYYTLPAFLKGHKWCNATGDDVIELFHTFD